MKIGIIMLRTSWGKSYMSNMQDRKFCLAILGVSEKISEFQTDKIVLGKYVLAYREHKQNICIIQTSYAFSGVVTR